MELTARFSWIDFFDADSPTATVNRKASKCPRQPSARIVPDRSRGRLLFNYTYAAPIDPTLGQSTASIFGTRWSILVNNAPMLAAI